MSSPGHNKTPYQDLREGRDSSDGGELRLELEPDPDGQARMQRWAAGLLSLVICFNLGVWAWKHTSQENATTPRRVRAYASAAPSVAADLPPKPTVSASPTSATPAKTSPTTSTAAESISEAPLEHTLAGRLKGRETVAGALSRAGLKPEQTFAIVQALKGVFNFRYARPGDGWRLKLAPDNSLLFFEYERSLLESYCVAKEEDGFRGYKKEIPVEREVVLVRGTLNSSLYESMAAAGERPGLALLLAEVLAWDIDFYRDPRPGDTFKILVEKDRYKERTLRYGRILAAEYRGGVGTYRVFRYPSLTGGETYYDEQGQSAQKALLRAPLKFVHITSTFGNRRHPILGYNKMHRGVDYGAAIGTPVRAVGDGRVLWASRKGANGNLVGLRHSNGYSTWYAHLSKIKVKKGQHVKQKDVIGLVGTTGRSTGPHLHYGIKKDGHFINPLKLKLPPRKPLPKKLLPEYTKHIAPLVRWLDTPGEVARLETSDATRPASPETPKTP